MYHTLIIVGALGRDPEKRVTSTGQSVTNFNVATNRRWTDKEAVKHEETTWFRIATWGKTADVCAQYLKKGRKVLVEGRLIPDPQTGGPRLWKRQDQTIGASFEVSAQVVRFLDSQGNVEKEVIADETEIPEDEAAF